MVIESKQYDEALKRLKVMLYDATGADHAALVLAISALQAEAIDVKAREEEIEKFSPPWLKEQRAK